MKGVTMNAKTRATLVIIGAFLSLTATTGSVLGSLPMYVVPMALRFGVSPATSGVAFTFLAAGSFIAAFFLGAVVKTLKGSKTVIVGGLLAAAGFLGVAYAPNVYVFWICGALLGAAITWAGVAIGQIYVTRWFVTNRGFFSGVIGVGEFAGTLLFSFTIANFIKDGNIVVGAQVTALIVFAVCLIVGLFLIKGFPEDYSLQPVGAETVDTSASASAPAGEVPGISYSEAIKKPILWIFLSGIAVLAIGQNTFIGQQAAVYTSIGMTPVLVATLMSSYSAAKVANKILFGIISDRVGLRFGILYTSVLFITGILLLTFAGTFGLLLVAAICIGSGAGMVANAGTLVIAKMFGRKDLVKLGPLPHTLAALGGIAGPLLFAFLFGLSGGTYLLPLIVTASIITLFLILSMISVRPSNMFETEYSLTNPKRSKKMQEESTK